MKLRFRSFVYHNLLCALAAFACVFYFIITTQTYHEKEREEEGEALDAFKWWYGQRAASDELVPQRAFARAFMLATRTMKKEIPDRTVNGVSTQWESIGPNNVGGRILSLAIDPSNTNILWAGSASGGLWKSTTKGVGANAWSYISTGFPTISVSAIAIDPFFPSTMYIGTGEISYYHYPLVGTPGARASYGMGILKSTDAGATWQQTSLTFTFPEITAIQRIVINPLNTNTLYSATSEGIYKSTDAGETWNRVLSVVMAMDIVINPVDTNILVSAHGNLNSSPNQGMYRTSDGGSTWTQLSEGLPTVNFGRTALSIAPSNPQVIFAGISNGASLSMIGLFKSTNGGISWIQTSSVNYVGSQGWYNNVVAAHPQSDDIVYCAGLNLYKSTTGGFNLTVKSSWTSSYQYQVPPGGAEGTPIYVHADHHALVFDPSDPNIFYMGTDGGVFQSTDGGETFAGRNGGLITTQFYGGFANSWLTETIAYGGLQDNGVLKYLASNAWVKVDDGDGGWCATDPRTDNVVYDEYVHLTISRSTNGGLSFSRIMMGLPPSDSSNFIAPFVISPSEPDILYAGAKRVYKTLNQGSLWFVPNNAPNLNGTKISCIGVSWTSSDTLMAATGTGTYSASPLFQVFLSKNGAASWANVTGILPARYPTDIHFDPSNSKNVYITYSGYETSHVFKTTNLGQTWQNISSNLPDVPVQSIVNDPEESNSLFIGTDLGVFHSSDDGATWNDFNAGMPPTMVTDVTIVPTNGMLRASTFGNGVYQRPVPRTPSLALQTPAGGEIFISGKTVPITWSQKHCKNLSILFSSDAGVNWDTVSSNVLAKDGSYLWTIPAASTENGKLKIINVEDSLIVDTSNAFFAIVVNPDVLEGWNLASINLLVNTPQKEILFPTATGGAYTFNNGYHLLDTLTNGYGYWLKFDKPQHFNFTGDSIFTDTVNVTARWNLLGSITTPVAVTDIVQMQDGLIISPFYGYEDGYFVADSIKPTKGYWVKAKNAGQVILSSHSSYSKQNRKLSQVTKNCFPINIEDQSGKKRTLYLGKGEAQDYAIDYEMPPLPPSGTFDVRFSSNKLVEFLPEELNQDVVLPVTISSAKFPIEMRLENNVDMNYEVIVQENGTETYLKSGTIVTIPQPTSSLVLHIKKSHALPAGFTLEQNFPNPFNPATNIKFRISESGIVQLHIYDILGKEITRLLNEYKQAGEYSIQWDAGGLPSGIYFYTLQTGNKAITKKLLLLK